MSIVQHSNPVAGRAGLVVGRRSLFMAAVLAAVTRRARAGTQVLRIGVQKYGTLVILRERGLLEPALDKLGFGVRWTEFPGGPQLLEAMNVGDLDFGTTGEAPPIFAQAAGAPLVYVGVEPPSPKGEAILLPAGSSIKSVADLRGKRVALNKGSNVHFLLVQALKSVGLTPANIEAVYLAPADARAAFEEGAVDAWVIWDPFYAAGVAATEARVLADATGLAPNRQYFLTTRGFAEAHADVVKALLAEIAATDRWAEANPDAATALLAPSLGLPPEIIRTALGRMGYGAGPMTAEAVADQQRIADTFYALKLIPEPVTVRDALWSPPT